MKSFIRLLKLFVVKHTVALSVLSIVSYISVYLTIPDVFYKSYSGIVESINKGQIATYGGRYKTDYRDVYWVHLNDSSTVISAPIDEIEAYGVDRIVGKKISFIQLNGARGIKYMLSLKVEEDIVFNIPKNTIQFIVSVLIAVFCTIGAVYGLIDEYWYGNEKKR
ncbi:MAG: hypothetical protein JXR53_07195 [Bacteroidales bacterium]|nr:hypothetical protein [Bacteroidales bacterium]